MISPFLLVFRGTTYFDADSRSSGNDHVKRIDLHWTAWNPNDHVVNPIITSNIRLIILIILVVWYQFWMFWLDGSKISKIRYIDHIYIDHYRSKIRKLILYSYYPLVNSHITMEHHHFSWENSIFLWPFFSIAVAVYQRVPIVWLNHVKSC